MPHKQTHLLLHCIVLLTIVHSTNAYGQRRAIDEETLTAIISAKQDEVKARVLSNLVSKNIRTTNYTTYNALYNLVDIIVSEKNKTVMTQGIVRQVADYTVTFTATEWFLKSHEIQPNSIPSEWVKEVVEVTKQGYREQMASAYEYEWTEPSDEYTRQQRKQIREQEKEIEQNLRDQRKAAKEKGSDSFKVYKQDLAKREKSEAKKDQNALEGVKIGPKGDTSVVFVNWVMDEIWMALASNNTLTDLGLFVDDHERKRFSSGLDINYDAYWFGYEADRDIIVEGIHSWVNTKVGQAGFIQKAVHEIKPKAAHDLSVLRLNSVGSIRDSTIAALFSTFTEALTIFRNDIGQNAFIAKVGDLIAKYVIVEPEDKPQTMKYHFIIDVEGLILAFESEFTNIRLSSLRHHWIGVKPFFTIGMNYGYLSPLDSAFEARTSYGMSQVAWAGEKLGLKFTFWDWGYTRSFGPEELFIYRGRYRKWLSPPTKPIINNLHGILYGSGLIYTIADLRTETTFAHPIVGAGLGVTFFNGLEMNLSYAVPMIPKTTVDEKWNAGMLNVGLDIPIFEYIREVRGKAGR